MKHPSKNHGILVYITALMLGLTVRVEAGSPPHGDANPPSCYVDSTEAGLSPSLCGIAQDDRPSEDQNGNGVLDPGEDANGNGQIDTDSGISSIELGSGAINLTLAVAPFAPGVGSVSYCVILTDTKLSGSGAVVITDGAGNQCTQAVRWNNRPEAGGSILLTLASGYVLQVGGSDDRYPSGSLQIYIVDTGTPGFRAGPFQPGDWVMHRKNSRQAPYSRFVGGSLDGIVQTRGQASVIAVNPQGAISLPSGIP